MSKNKLCSSYLGVYIAEQVLSKVFNDVKQMPPTNPGFDFICNRGMKIDVKSSCIIHKNQKYSDRWTFTIRRNTVADYFLCLTFDNRKDLNPLYMWLLPANEFNMYDGIGISITTTSKWDEYKLDVSKVIQCCDNRRITD